MSSSSTVAAGPAAAGGRASGPPPRSRIWRPVAWSGPAAIRALRAAVVLPGLLALTDVVIGDAQMTLFAVFGGFAALVVAGFGGTRRDKAVATLGLAVAGGLAVTVGTAASETTWLAVVVTVPVAFVIYYAGSAGPNAAAGVTACLFAFVLPVASAGTIAELPARLAGWWLACGAATAAVLALSPRPPADRVRGQSARLASRLAVQLEQALSRPAGSADASDAIAARDDLLLAFNSVPYRPAGAAAAEQGLASVVHLLEWCSSLVAEVTDGHLDLAGVARADRDLLRLCAGALRQTGAILAGEPANPDLAAIWQARLASAADLPAVADEPAVAVRRADGAFHAQAIAVAAAAAMGDALIAVRRSTPARVAQERRGWIANLPDSAEAAPGPGGARGRRLPASVRATVSADASLRSVWFRNSARGAIALAAAVAVARITDVQHAFWIVLGTLSVLRTSAAATGATALRALAGTAAGFVIGAVLLLGIGTTPAALWVVFPLAVLVTAYAPGTATFEAGQAAFTVTVVVLFNLLAPAGWAVGLLRVEDVAIGCAVSLAVGFLFWPRGASAVVGDNLADALRSGADYLRDAARWALGDLSGRPRCASAALSAGYRLDDAVRGYLTEQGSKRLTRADLWTLVMAATRLRLTAHSMASLPARTRPHADDSGLHAALGRELAAIGDFYLRLAAEVGRHGRGQPLLPPPSPPAAVAALAPCGVSAAYRSDALWVGHHLEHVRRHLADLPAPAARLAAVRRRGWWH